MIIQHNLSALNSHRYLGMNNRDSADALEKLSSGYKVNRAADDAAGLAISEKMRGQIRGLAMAEQNTSHAIDLIQTAEGALGETHAILQRMRELAVQSSNGTYQDEDRAQIALEFNALKSEVNRIADSTHYNGIKLLDGSLGSVIAAGTASTGTVSIGGADTDYTFFGLTASGELVPVQNYTGTVTPGLYLDNGQVKVAPGTNFTYDESTGMLKGPGPANLTIGPIADSDQLKELLTYYGNTSMGNPLKLVVTGSASPAKVSIAATATVSYSNAHSGFETFGLNVTAVTPGVSTSDGPTIEISRSGGAYLIKVGGASQIATLDQLKNGTGGVTVGGVKFELMPAPDDERFTSAMKSSTITVDNIDTVFVNRADGRYVLDFSNIEILARSGLVFQIGANGGEDQRVSMSIESMSASTLGLKAGDTLSDGTVIDPGVSLQEARIDHIEQANLAIEIITKSSQQVSAQRAGLGAMQNRLEHTLNGLGVTKENLTAAESVIRDTDMAAAMTEFTRTNILGQAAQAMLAQANQIPQGVLQLLR